MAGQQRATGATDTKMAFENGRHFRIAEIMALSGNLNLAIRRPVLATEAPRSRPWIPGNLVDGRTPLGPPIRPEIVKRDLQGDPGTGRCCWSMFTLDLGRVRTPADPAHPIHARGAVDTPGVAFPTAFRIESATSPDFGDARLSGNSIRFPTRATTPSRCPAATPPPATCASS